MDLTFRRHADVSAPLAGAELLSVAVDNDAAISCLWRRGEDAWLARGSDANELLEFRLPTVSYPHLAVWPDGGFVVADGRVRGSVSAWTFDPNGELEAEGTLGDAIEHMLATPNGRLWVGYFDEGAVYDGDLEGHGLVRFDRHLRPEWKFPQRSELGEIADCYALNVWCETAMAYFYADFDIVEVDGDRGRRWVGAPRGAHGLLTDGSSCVLVGGYEGERDRVVHLHLADGDARAVGAGQVRGLPDALHRRWRMCRGLDMHVVIDDCWYRATAEVI